MQNSEKEKYKQVRDEDEGDRGANESLGPSHPHVRPHPRRVGDPKRSSRHQQVIETLRSSYEDKDKYKDSEKDKDNDLDHINIQRQIQSQR